MKTPKMDARRKAMHDRLLGLGPDPMAEERERERAAQAAQAAAAGPSPRKPGRKPRARREGWANPWAAALHAFVRGQESVAEPLSANARVAWHWLHCRADGENGMQASAGVDQVAAGARMSEWAARRALRELVASGHLERLVRGQKNRGVSRYRVVGDPHA